MKALNKFGGFAALYLAMAYLIGITLFLVVLDYPSITDAAQKVTLLVEKQTVIFGTNLVMYVFLGIFLVALSLAFYERLKSGMTAVMQVLGGGDFTVAEVHRLIGSGSLDAEGYMLLGGVVIIIAALCMLTSRFGVFRILNSKP